MIIMPEKKKTAEKGTKSNRSEAAAPTRHNHIKTPVYVGNYPFKIDTAELTIKKVGRSKTTTNGILYESGRVTVPKEWIDKDVIVMLIDSNDKTNRKSIDQIQKDDEE